jgi:HEAT repeat protein
MVDAIGRSETPAAAPELMRFADDPEIRRAFRDRRADGDAPDATEDDVHASAEAAMGLARRHDPAVRPWLERQLALPEHEVGNLVVEAAGELGDPALLPALLALRDAGWHLHPQGPKPGTLQEAIDALEPTP